MVSDSCVEPAEGSDSWGAEALTLADGGGEKVACMSDCESGLGEGDKGDREGAWEAFGELGGEASRGAPPVREDEAP